MADRGHWLREIERLDPHRDFADIYRITYLYEFPWDLVQSLGFALFRTYAVPSIGRLLHETGEFTERTQKRYDDTLLLLDEVLMHGLDSSEGRAGVRRVNQMHAMYAISNDDMRYVLATFVVVPMRWLDDFGWRPMSETERIAAAEYYKELGRHMAIRDVPETHQEFAATMDAYEAEHFAYDEGGRKVADATLDLMTTFPPFHLLPAGAIRRFSYALMDDPLLDALGYDRPSPAMRRAAFLGMRARARALRAASPRLRPQLSRDLPQVRSYPAGWASADLGTFAPPPACPAHLTRAGD